MQETNESEHCRSGVDRISQLPDNVIDKILTSMPMVEAARTVVLSRNWKRGWKNISKLVFDSSFGTKFEKPGRPNLMLAMYQTLFLHLGGIDGFTLSIPWLESCAYINPLIQFLSEKKVKHLKIHFEKGDSHILPSYLFSCFQLSTLDLDGCAFNPPQSFGGFSQLLILNLKRVDITSDFFGMFISYCPQLQQLSLIYCNFREVSSINIIAPNLRTFCYVGHTLFICFVSAPLLDQMAFYESNCKFKGVNFDRSKKLYLHEFCSAVPALRSLVINEFFLKILEARDLSGQPSQRPNCLQHLTVYTCLSDLEDVSSLLGLIRRSPNLEQFSAKIRKCDHVGHVANSFFNILEPDQNDVSCNKLQNVQLFKFNGTDPEMEFVKFLLSESPQLKAMTIHQASKDDQKWLQILKKMIRFQRASAVVDINFCDPEVASV